MSESALMTACKAALRVTGTNTFDGEITDLLAAAQEDLIQSGIDETMAATDTDSLIKMAKIVYVKAHFGYNNPDAEALKEDYRARVCKMVLLEDYRGE